MVWDKRDEGLDDVTRALVGQSKRIAIPMHSKILFRDVADALRGLAQVMDVHSRLRETSEKDTLLRIAGEINHTNRLIKTACKRYDVELRDGRPPDSKRLGKGVNTTGTPETVSSFPPPHIVKTRT